MDDMDRTEWKPDAGIRVVIADAGLSKSYLVLRTRADSHGWDVLIEPYGGGEQRWVGSRQLDPDPSDPSAVICWRSF